MSHGVFITYESCPLVEMGDWSVILSLWYFKLYCEFYSTHFIQLKDGDMVGHEKL
jgi:hypothetical protein